MFWVTIHSHWSTRWTRSLSWAKSIALSVLCAMFCNMFHLIVMVFKLTNVKYISDEIDTRLFLCFTVTVSVSVYTAVVCCFCG